MAAIDLTLTLGLPSAKDDHRKNDQSRPQVPQQQFNAFAGAASGFGSGASSGNAQATEYSAVTMMDYQRAVSVTERRKMQEFCLIDISNRQGKVGGSKKRKPPRCERHPVLKPEDLNRTCSNFNCRVLATPMWRRGPLGPKTLCNACGIKYRKLKLKEQQGEGLSGEGPSGEGSSNSS